MNSRVIKKLLYHICTYHRHKTYAPGYVSLSLTKNDPSTPSSLSSFSAWSLEIDLWRYNGILDAIMTHDARCTILKI